MLMLDRLRSRLKALGLNTRISILYVRYYARFGDVDALNVDNSEFVDCYYRYRHCLRKTWNSFNRQRTSDSSIKLSFRFSDESVVDRSCFAGR